MESTATPRPVTAILAAARDPLATYRTALAETTAAARAARQRQHASNDMREARRLAETADFHERAAAALALLIAHRTPAPPVQP